MEKGSGVESRRRVEGSSRMESRSRACRWPVFPGVNGRYSAMIRRNIEKNPMPNFVTLKAGWGVG
jgi:hypothetical protein